LLSAASFGSYEERIWWQCMLESSIAVYWIFVAVEKLAAGAVDVNVFER
jgi:hypothetical protein